MPLSTLEKLELQEQLADLLIQSPTASGLDKLDILEGITLILEKLGYGSSPDTGVPPTESELPQLVTDFKQGVYKSADVGKFIETLQELEQFVPSFITLDEVKAGTVDWVTEHSDLIKTAA